MELFPDRDRNRIRHDLRQEQVIAPADMLIEAANQHWYVLSCAAGDGNTYRDGIPSIMEVAISLFHANHQKLTKANIQIDIELRLLERALYFFSEGESHNLNFALNMAKIIIDGPETLETAADAMEHSSFQWTVNTDSEVARGVIAAKSLTQGFSFTRQSIIDRLRSHSLWMQTGGTWTDLYDNDTEMPSLIEPTATFLRQLESYKS